ncbi:hypothetical protein GWK41_04020 [Persephonella atlantica]|uniref:Lipoprotein n=1 Tax=Persephonella atlantica TaxID=2699429 RepID=A0ABS1GH65_9AQUI|nr:hypothetical protein [Persephonella atlantica]MBK3332233.1 hypothetical protein [Persephonella atlantica]
MMKISRYIFSLLVILGFITAGCNINAQNAFSKEPVKLQPFTERVGDYVFSVPSNFSRKDDLSMLYENKGIVRAYLVYIGKASTQKLVNFFEKYMKKNGWSKELFVAGKDTVLAYSRGKQLIVFKIQQTFNGTVLKVLLTTN